MLWSLNAKYCSLILLTSALISLACSFSVLEYWSSFFLSSSQNSLMSLSFAATMSLKASFCSLIAYMGDGLLWRATRILRILWVLTIWSIMLCFFYWMRLLLAGWRSIFLGPFAHRIFWSSFAAASSWLLGRWWVRSVNGRPCPFPWMRSRFASCPPAFRSYINNY